MPRKKIENKLEKEEGKLTIDVYNAQGQVVGKTELDPRIFGAKVNEELIAQAVRVYLANQRQGSAATKTRAQVRGGGRKPWRQKGTGRARQGSIRAPHWRGGGIVFGPQPKDYSMQMPKKMKRSALISALSSKLTDKGLVVLDSLELKEPKTKHAYRVLKNLPIQEKVLLVLPERDELVLRAVNNLAKVKVTTASNINTYEVINNQSLVMPKQALKAMEDFFFKKESKEEEPKQ
jgi:large subunit ribosomal protein L4